MLPSYVHAHKDTILLQAFDQLHANGQVNAEDVVVMVECHLHASKHWSALQMLKHHSLLAAAALPPHKQRNLFDIVLESRSLQKCSPQLLLKLLAAGLQQQTPDATRQLSELVTACLQDQDMQLVKQVRRAILQLLLAATPIIFMQ